MQADELKGLFPGYTTIKDALTMGDLKKKAQDDKIELSVLLSSEKEKDYSATDNSGNIYLVKNPAIWEEKIIDGFVVRIKPVPILHGKIKQQGYQQKKTIGAV